MATYRASAAGGGSSGSGDRAVTFTPAVGDLPVICVNTSGNTNNTPTCTDNNGSGTYHLVACVAKGASADRVAVFVRNAKMVNTTSTTATVATGTNTAGEAVAVLISGMTRVGSAAVRQFASQANQAAGTPAPAFSAAALTGNLTIGMIGNTSNPATMTQPTGWTERQDVGQASPNTGLHVVTRDSGFTGTAVTWGNASGSTFASIIVELDTTSAPVLLGETVSGPSESLDAIKSATAPLPETVAYSEALASVFHGLAPLPETVAHVEALTSLWSARQPLPETVAWVAAVIASRANLIPLPETVTGPSESLAALQRATAALPETVAHGEALGVEFQAFVGFTEQVPWTAALVAGRGTAAVLGETIATWTAALVAVRHAITGLPETVAHSEALASRFQGLQPLGESVPGLGAVLVALRRAIVATPETVAHGEVLAAIKRATAPLPETVANLAGSLLAVYRATAPLGELLGTLGESVVAEHQSSGGGTSYSADISETVPIAEGLFSMVAIGHPLEEAIALLEAVGAVYRARTTGGDVLAIVEAIRAARGQRVAVDETWPAVVVEVASFISRAPVELAESVPWSASLRTRSNTDEFQRATLTAPANAPANVVNEPAIITVTLRP